MVLSRMGFFCWACSMLVTLLLGMLLLVSLASGLQVQELPDAQQYEDEPEEPVEYDHTDIDLRDCMQVHAK